MDEATGTPTSSQPTRRARIFHAALDLLLPAVCAACRDPVADHNALCPSCWKQVSFISEPVCERLGTPLPFDIGPGALSPAAIANPPDFDRARAAFRYDAVGRALIHALKYGDRQEVGPVLARWMARAGHRLLTDADALVPVPLHWTRLFSRRFNQAAELARAVAAISGVAYEPQLLVRGKRTRHQIGLSKAARATNVQGAFKVSPERLGWVRGRRIILVDDVLTTGATVAACTRALRRAGAVRIDVLTAARVVDGAGTIHI
ncbi:MAG: ComF family protein [Alphaproteobacteria bacterium]